MKPDFFLHRVGDVVMDLQREKLVRIIRDTGPDYYTVRDILTNVQLIAAPDELGEETYNEMETVAWAANQT